MKYIYYIHSRPDFGKRQIRTVRGLHIDQYVIGYRAGYGTLELFQVEDLDIQNKYILLKRLRNNTNQWFGLEEFSIIPLIDSNGVEFWNSGWCLLRTKARTMAGLGRSSKC